jgi:hypothetical protein
MEIEDHGLIPTRRQMPDDHPLAIGGVENDFFGRGQAGSRRRCAKALRKILQTTLCHIEQGDQRGIADERED